MQKIDVIAFLKILSIGTGDFPLTHIFSVNILWNKVVRISNRFTVKLSGVLFLSFFLMLQGRGAAQSSEPKKTLRVGVLLDLEVNASLEFIRRLEHELSQLLQSRYTVSITPDNTLRCNWSSDCIEKNYQRFAGNPGIDIIIGLGPLSGELLTRRPVYPKPVIVVGVIDPFLQKISVTPEQTSGVSNLTFIIFPQSLDADLETFRRLYPYQRICLVEDHRMMDIIPLAPPLIAALKKKGISGGIISVDSLEAVTEGELEGYDAVVLGNLYRFEARERAKLIEKINRLKLPTFSMIGERDLKMGALAATRMEADIPRLVRRVALNIERILDGENAATLPLTFQHQENLQVNMTTADRIGVSPPWDILLESELIRTEGADDTVNLGLKDTITEALTANRTLAAQKQVYQSKEKDVDLSRTPLFPQVGGSARARLIDENQAVGGAAEKTVSGGLGVDQVLFSESLLANLSVSRHQLAAARYSLDQTELDTVQTSGVAYFDILRAMTNRRIRKEYLDMVKENLNISKKRLAVGYSGAADVYRWESELANAKNGLIEAHAFLLAAKQRLNQILSRPVDDPVAIADVRLSDKLFHQYPETDLRKYVSNPASMKFVADFLVAEATANLPEIKEIDQAIAANKRMLASYQRKRYLPDVVASAQADRVFSRTGEGSDVPLPDENSWQMGVNANWTLFPGGEISVRSSQLRIDISRLKTQREDLIHGLELTLRNNIVDIVAKSFNITFSRKAADAGAKNLDLVRDAYEKGQVSIVQLLDAQNAALTSDVAATNAIYEYFTSYLKLERSMGRFVLLTPKAKQVDFFNRLIQYLDEKKLEE